MQVDSRRLLDRSFSGLGIFSIGLVAASLVILLGPIIAGGIRAFVFRGTVEHREVMLEQFGHGDRAAVEAEMAAAFEAREPLFELMTRFEAELADMRFMQRREYADAYEEFKDYVRKLLGPLPGEPEPKLLRKRYGQTRWDRAEVTLHHALHLVEWDYSDPSQMGQEVHVPRAREFESTTLEPAFALLDDNLEDMLRPQWTFYWRFLFDHSEDAHFFGGIWAEVLGTLYLTIGAILFAVPMGVISAIYLTEYARDGRLIRILRTCISTLAGVPSIVFGLFGLAFFINTIHVSDSPSVLAGSLTLAVLILPVVIRAAEEAVRAVPATYKEAALSMGASKWRTIVTVILPAALPGILTGIVISMGRAAGETAPIIFTAAASAGQPLALWDVFSERTPALPWNIYNLATEHEAVDEIRHVQYGMVLTLVMLVLLLNGAAIVMRARISRKLTG